MVYMFLGVCAFSVILSIMATIAQHASSTARRASTLGAGTVNIVLAVMRCLMHCAVSKMCMSGFQIQPTAWRSKATAACQAPSLRQRRRGCMC